MCSKCSFLSFLSIVVHHCYRWPAADARDQISALRECIKELAIKRFMPVSSSLRILLRLCGFSQAEYLMFRRHHF